MQSYDESIFLHIEVMHRPAFDGGTGTKAVLLKQFCKKKIHQQRDQYTTCRAAKRPHQI